ncbi:MAG: hypothetical protein JRJ70_10275 [Deltaproteobacteria bacterium]|nr:hypothetical protein [Deltaproteobacteria bacterium]
MRRKNTLFGLATACIGIAVVMALVSCATTGPGAGSKAAVSVVGDGTPGSDMKIKGTGFIPGETIELTLEMEDVPIIVGKKGKVITVKEDGTFAATTNYPHKFVAVPGSWDLIANGTKGSSARCKVAITKP